MSSASEARFRVQAPNSRPRQIKVIALDAPSEGIVRRLTETAWAHADFFTAAVPDGADSATGVGAGGGWLRSVEGDPKDLIDEVDRADLVVMVAVPGERIDAVRMIGEACSHRRVTTTALIVGSEAASDEALSITLKQLRPWSLMVVIANADDYVEDMLVALRGR